MAFSRAAAFRSYFRAARPTASRPQLLRQIARRGYASGGHESAKAGGDAVWAAGAIAVTVPSCWYLLQNGPDTSHGHGGHGDAHGEAHKEKEKEEPEDEAEAEEKPGEKSEDDGEDKDSEKSEDTGSDDDAKGADTPDTSDDEGEKKDGNTVKKVPDAKGGSKKSAESEKGTKAGETGDEAATSKPAGSQNTQSGKQEGLSNTDTKHSTDLTKDPEKSTKGDGTPDSAKAKGTVKSSRAQV